MSLYQLEVLNDKEFEELCKDLLEKELGLLFQIFKTGKDKGIDLRYAENRENEIIIQAKRYVKSTFSNLTSELHREKDKMHKLMAKPQRYILMTAFDPTVSQTDHIVTLMSPFIKTSQDVYGRDRINNLIKKYPDIEKKYYKLWLTSTTILKRILHNGAEGRSEFFKEKILKRASLYVPTKNFKTALDKLREHHFLIISGEPGVGKTTISYLLICEFLAKDFQLINVDGQLSDAEHLLNPSPKLKQIIFFDDFLGANLTEIVNPRNSENKLVGFIERIQASENKLLIMTTRTTILRQAQHHYEKFNHMGLADISQYRLEIGYYSRLDKAKILYNHLFHSGMAGDQYDLFFQSETYLKIIQHKNYFPRLVEFITSVNQLKNVTVEQTDEFIFSSLNNPAKIWQSAYEQQLNAEEQFLLQTLFSLGSYKVSGDLLETAFEERYQYEIRTNGFSRKADAYQQSLKKLLDGFVKSEKIDHTRHLQFSLLNPSVGDFMLNYLKIRFGESKRIFYSAVYFIQVLNFFDNSLIDKTVYSKDNLKELFESFNQRIPLLQKQHGDGTEADLFILYIWLYAFHELATESLLYDRLQRVNPISRVRLTFYQFKHILARLERLKTTRVYIKRNWLNFFIVATELCWDSSDIKTVTELLRTYKIKQEIWSANEEFMSYMSAKVNDLYTSDDLDFSSDEESIVSYCEFGSHFMARRIIDERLSNDFWYFVEDCGLDDYFDTLIERADLGTERILDNILDNANNNKRYPDDDGDDRVSGYNGAIDEDKAIRELFER
ncbi:MAG TPA: restriction endonuclease [Mucilaginibacter sp.]|jgi:DNA polymerase III delta prime subunit|nr:restriction endonuclease [Mucilaginibacter sp.]